MPLHTPLLATLTAIVGENYLLTDPAEIAPYVQDWRGRYRGAACAVVKPANTEEVAAVVRACVAAGVAMVPQGGNTSLCGGATPDNTGNSVIISLSRLNQVLAIDVENNTMTVQAGCTLAAVQAAAAAKNRLFPLSLASEGTCQIGGNLSTNAGGVQVLRYGNTRDLTLGLEVVLPNGEIWQGLRGLRKDNTGYDLKHLFIGAEGTLGLITTAVLKLFPRPAAHSTVWLGLNDPAAALAVLAAAQEQFDARLTAFELIAHPALALVLKNIPNTHSPFAGQGTPNYPHHYPYYVLLEIANSSNASASFSANAELNLWLEQQLEQGRIENASLASSLAQARQLWALRENISEAQKIEGVSIKHDISVPVSAIPRFLAMADSALQQHFPGIRIVTFGHVGDGNLHYNLSKPEHGENQAFLAQQATANQIVHDIVAKLGGSISAEHGLGQLKREEIKRYKSAVELQLMQQIKTTLDPLGLMNPGKVV